MPPQERNILSRQRNKVMVGLLVTQGLRVEELKALKVPVYDLRKAQYLAGHRHVSSTESYKQQVLDELQVDVKKFHPF